MRKQTQRVTVNASGHIAHGRVKGESKSSLPISKSRSPTSLLSMPVLARAQCSLHHLPLLKINDNHSQQQPLTVRVLGSCRGLEMPGLNLPRSEVSATMPTSQMSRLKLRIHPGLGAAAVLLPAGCLLHWAGASQLILHPFVQASFTECLLFVRRFSSEEFPPKG